MITLASITLVIFLLRCFVFTFRESPKFLLSKGHDAHALDVLYSIATFNSAPEPSLTFNDFQALNYSENLRSSKTIGGASIEGSRPVTTGSHAKRVTTSSFNETFGHLRGLFATKTQGYLFVVIAVA